MPCSGFFKSLLSLQACMDVKFGLQKLTFKSSATTKAHIHRVCFLKMLLGVKWSTDTHCLIRETGQLPLYFYRFRCVARFWNSLLTTNNALLSKVNVANLRLAHRKGSWTFEVLFALHEIPGADVHVSAIMSRSKINMSDFELFLPQQTIWEWRDLDQIHPHDAHVSSRVMRTYNTHFGVPIGSQTGWWDDQKRATKSTLPSYLRQNIPYHFSRALSRFRLSSHNLRIGYGLNSERLWQQQHRVPNELRICTKCNRHCVHD